jgi:hypothetical protein
MILKTLEVSIESMICPVSSIGGRGGGGAFSCVLLEGRKVFSVCCLGSGNGKGDFELIWKGLARGCNLLIIGCCCLGDCEVWMRLETRCGADGLCSQDRTPHWIRMERLGTGVR